jgi:hypothetical protein
LPLSSRVEPGSRSTRLFVSLAPIRDGDADEMFIAARGALPPRMLGGGLDDRRLGGQCVMGEAALNA